MKSFFRIVASAVEILPIGVPFSLTWPALGFRAKEIEAAATREALDRLIRDSEELKTKDRVIERLLADIEAKDVRLAEVDEQVESQEDKIAAKDTYILQLELELLKRVDVEREGQNKVRAADHKAFVAQTTSAVLAERIAYLLPWSEGLQRENLQLQRLNATLGWQNDMLIAELRLDARTGRARGLCASEDDRDDKEAYGRDGGPRDQ